MYRVDQKGKALVVSPWEQNGNGGVMVNVVTNGVSNSIVLSANQAMALKYDLAAMLEDFDFDD